MTDVNYMTWTPWEKKFAWLPKRLNRRVPVSADGRFWHTDHSWAWASTYYERSMWQLGPLDMILVVYDHETDVFGVLSKA